MFIKTMHFHSKYTLCFYLCLATCLYCNLSIAQHHKNQIALGYNHLQIVNQSALNSSNMKMGDGVFVAYTRQINANWDVNICGWSASFKPMGDLTKQTELMEQGAIISSSEQTQGQLQGWNIGVKYKFLTNKIRPYLGVRLGSTTLIPTQENIEYTINDEFTTYSSQTTTTSSYAFGANLGAQYFITDRWALTGEFSYLYSNINSEQLEFNNIQTINAAIGLSYCFSIKALDTKK